MGSLNIFHPEYSAMLSKWRLGNHSYEGEDAIKEEGVTYLPPTSGQIIDGQGKSPTSKGHQAYLAYKMRAVYPDTFREAVEAAIGAMHRKPPIIELPAGMEEIREKATPLGESLELLLRNINAQQLITGRVGLLGDLAKVEGKVTPTIIQYGEQAIINWDDSAETKETSSFRFVILDESGYVLKDGFQWDLETKYKVLVLADRDGSLDQEGYYQFADVSKEDLSLEGLTYDVPELMGSELDEIPFVVINGKDLSASTDTPPLHGLANLCLAIYRGEADYRQNLFMQGQDTLVRIGAIADPDEEVRTGAGARIDVPIGGDAKYIGVTSAGLSEQRSCLENDNIKAAQKGGQLRDATSRQKESGEALKIRVSAQSATLPQIAVAGAAGLERILKILAKWFGYNPDEVSVTPNLEFTDEEINGQNLVYIMQGKTLGAPISEQSIHNWLVVKGITEMDYDTEMALIEAEAPRLLTEPAPNDNE